MVKAGGMMDDQDLMHSMEYLSRFNFNCRAQSCGLASDDARMVLLHSMTPRTHSAPGLRESAVWCCEARPGTACYSSWLIGLPSAVWQGRPVPTLGWRARSIQADWLPGFPGTSARAGSGRGTQRDCCCWMKCSCIGDEQARRWRFGFLRRQGCYSGVVCESAGRRRMV